MLYDIQSNDASKLHAELLKNGLEKWDPYYDTEQNVLKGSATFKSFEEAFRILIRGSSINNVHFRQPLYNDWFWIASDVSDKKFFEDMDEKLNDDCILNIIKHLDLQHIIYFAHINERFQSIAKLGLSVLRIFPSTIGSINLWNFRYMLHMFGSTLTELSVSLNIFPATFGLYFDHTKKQILQLICMHTEIKLKRVNLYDFNFNENEIKDFGEHFFIILRTRGVEVNLRESRSFKNGKKWQFPLSGKYFQNFVIN